MLPRLLYFNELLSNLIAQRYIKIITNKIINKIIKKVINKDYVNKGL